MYNCDYIGYRKSVGDLLSSGATAASSGARVFATGGADISADIALIASGAAFAAGLWDQWTSHPAADARDFISKLKPQLASADPYNRLLLVMAGDTKINHRAKDVSAKELVMWYRQNYPNDYMTLTPDAKNYWNNYLVNAANQATDVNQASRDYINSKFTTVQINYNATPVQTISNLFTSATNGTTNWVLYSALAIGAILLIKNLK
jgi:hypothetical protein